MVSAAIPVAPVAEGEIVADKYQVGRLIGFGGMGVVCEARHLELDRMVAIKFVRTEFAENEEFVVRFLNEARAAAALQSAHIALVLDCGRLPTGIPYMVLEYLDGSDLDTVLKRGGPLSSTLATDYALQTCEALAEAHAARIVHRDIKPENLFLTGGPGGMTVVKVLDFGVAKRLDTIADPGITDHSKGIGSPHYMSPEQMTSPSSVDARSDIWSLGAVLYELLAGRPPFDGGTLPEICARVIAQQAPPLRSFARNVPPRLEAVVMRCLEKEPSKRYSDVGELAEALVPFASQDGAASADYVARILGRQRRRISVDPVAELVVELPPESVRRSAGSIPGVKKSKLPAIFVLLVMLGATAIIAWMILFGGQLPGSSAALEATSVTPLPGLAEPSASAPSTASTPRRAPPTPVRPGAQLEPTASPQPSPAPKVKPKPLPSGGFSVPVPTPPALPEPEEFEPREQPRKPGDPRDFDPPGIGTVPAP